jgi:uncharacterized membrane protein YheB (UPF0754 family)
LTFQGLVPRTREEIARKVSKAIVENLLDSQDLHEVLRRVPLGEHVRKVTDQIIEREMSTSLLGRFRFSGAVIERLVPVLQKRVAESLPQTLDDIDKGTVLSFLKEIDLETHLRGKIESLDLDELEALIRQVSRRELRTIELLGGVIGAVVGALEGVIYQFL